MSRTYKDMPLYIRMRHNAKKRVTNEEFTLSKFHRNWRGQNDPDFNKMWKMRMDLWSMAHDELRGDRGYPWGEGVPKEYRKARNKRLKQRNKQNIIRGREMEPFKKNAAWDWF